MRKRLLVVLFSFIPLIAVAETIVVLGDSISAAYGMPLESGWVNLLSQRLDKKYPGRFEVVNASVSGDTTAGGLMRLPSLLEQHQPDLVVVELGGNDGLRGMSLSAMRSNLATMIELSQQQGAEVILISVDLPTSYGIHFNRRFQQIFDQLETSYRVPRLALGFDQLNDRNLIQEDGIHPTAAAQPILLDAVWPLIVGG